MTRELACARMDRSSPTPHADYSGATVGRSAHPTTRSCGQSERTWIICELDYKGRRRTPLAPDRLTELFFLDEVTMCRGRGCHKTCR